MNFKRICMGLISLVLVACLLVNVSPIKAEAASVGAGLTGWQALLFFISASAGVLLKAEIPTEPPAIIQSAEQSFDEYVIGNYEFYFPDIDPDNDDDTDFEDFWNDLKDGVNQCFEDTGNFNSLGEYLGMEKYADWVYAKHQANLLHPAITIGEKLDKLFSQWFVDLYDKGFFELFVDSPYNNSSFYNDWLLPDMPADWDSSQHPYITVFGCINDDGTMSGRLYVSDIPFLGYTGETGRLHGNTKLGQTVNYFSRKLYVDSNLNYSWGSKISGYLGTSMQTGPGIPGASIVYTNYDFVSYRDGSVILAASPPISKTSVNTIQPDLFFGDYAEQNEAGTLTSDSFNLPEYDFSNYIYDNDSVREEMNDVYDQIMNGQMSYDDYMESITYDESIGDSSSGDSSDSSGGSGGSGSDNDYLSDKINALLEEYAFAASIVNTAKAIKTGLAGITTEPPVIYIHLENTRGSHNIGGTVPFLDLRWYAEYKPTVDTIISAFLWICFAWKMLLKLPGIISGMPGDFVMDSVHHIGMSEHMPVRKAEYEVQRVSSREYMRRGKDG